MSRRAGWVVALAVAAMTAAGCSGGGTDAMSAADSGGNLAAEKAVGPAADAPAAADASERQGANRAAVRTQAVINTGRATLLAKDLDRTRDELARLVQRHGGFIAAERSTSDRDGRIESASMELRVPASAFTTVLDGLRDIATVRHVQTTSEDVTTQVIDVDSRVRSMKASLAQLRKLMLRATDVATMLQIESDIATREAELESALAQQRYLQDQTAMSTLDVELQRPPREATPRPDDEGFLAGLRGGWHALGASAAVALTAVGAVLPFAVLLALVGVPVWLLVRRTTRRPQPAVAGPAPQPTDDSREP